MSSLTVLKFCMADASTLAWPAEPARGPIYDRTRRELQTKRSDATVFGVGKKLVAQLREEFRCLLEVQAVAVLREVFDDRL